MWCLDPSRFFKESQPRVFFPPPRDLENLLAWLSKKTPAFFPEMELQLTGGEILSLSCSILTSNEATIFFFLTSLLEQILKIKVPFCNLMNLYALMKTIQLLCKTSTGYAVASWKSCRLLRDTHEGV